MKKNKKNLIKAVLAVVFFCAVGYTVYTAQSKNEKLSGWALANVEALARYELPEVVITCGSSSGDCWITDTDECWLDMLGFSTFPFCRFVGYTDFSCYTLCD